MTWCCCPMRATPVLVLFDGEETEKIGYELDGDRLVLDLDVQAYRMSGPLVREPLPETTPSAAADPALTGVWGGMERGKYVEHVFFSDGRYLRFSPYDEAETEAGNYLADGNTLAVLTREGSSKGNYHTKTHPDPEHRRGEETSFVRRVGPRSGRNRRSAFPSQDGQERLGAAPGRSGFPAFSPAAAAARLDPSGAAC